MTSASAWASCTPKCRLMAALVLVQLPRISSTCDPLLGNAWPVSLGERLWDVWAGLPCTRVARGQLYRILDAGFATAFALPQTSTPPSLLMNFPRASSRVGLGL